MKVEDEETLQSKQLSEYFKQRPEYKRLLKEKVILSATKKVCFD